MCQASLGELVPDHGYGTCRCCGGMFLVPYPTQQQNIVFEGPTAVARQQALEESRASYFLRHLLRIEKQMSTAVQNWRLMEVGCGSGVLLRIAHERGWEADALEFSPELAALARQACPAAAVTEANVLDYTTGCGDYDAVLALDVLEHVLDPHLMLRNCCALLKPGGLLLLQTPNTRSLRGRLEGPRWEMRDPDQHLNLFSPRGLKDALVATGFELVALNTVSGSGLERGWSRIPMAVRQWLLDRGKLGNALCVLARRK